MKKALLLSVVASTMIMAGGDIAPVEPVVEAPVAEASGWEFGGQGVLYYQTTDAWGNGSLFESDSSKAAAGVQLRAINKDLVGGIGAGVEMSGISDFYLYDGVVTGLVQNAGNTMDPGDADTVNSSAAFTQAYLTYGTGNTSFKLGRQLLPKALSPFAFSEGWNVFKNSFEALLVVNSDVQDTTLVGAYVTRANSSLGNLNDFTDINDDGVWMLTAANKSIEGVALTGTWYYASEFAASEDANILWADAKFGVAGLNIGLQGGVVMCDALADDGTGFGAKIGGKWDAVSASLAFSSAGEGFPIHNLGTGVKTPFYTQMIFNQNSIKQDSDTIVARVGMKALGGKFGLAYGYSDMGANAPKAVTGSVAGEGEYAELDLTYKTKVWNDSTTLFAGYVYQDDDRMSDTQNMIRLWGRYNF